MSTEPPPLYLGFDLSTQQLKAIVVSSDLHVVSEAKVDFDADFGAKYGITKGVLTDEAEGEVFAPVAMWLEAVDLVLRRLRDTGCPLARVRGISGSCQQHGSVFWSAEGERALQALNTEGSATDDDDDDGLLARLRGAFAYQYGPNWQDHSTQAECDLFDAHLGGAHKLAEVTGSAAHHRFTGPQIMRMCRKRPEVYEKTARISLVSSFLASVFLGKTAPIDIGDVTGMNLWDMKAQAWSEPLLELAAGSAEGVAALRRKLGDVPLDGGGSLGGVARYFADRYGFRSDGYCRVAPFTGDNPATILALPLRPLDAIVSLGTSTTFLMVTPTYRPDPSYHFMNHPASPGHYMFMLCYKNGGLAREKVRDALPAATTAPKDGGGDPWAAFNAQVLATPPLDVRDPAVDRAKIGLYFPLPEIVPNVRAGTWRYTCRATDGGDLREADWDAATDARAIVESQALSMRLRSHNLVSPPPPPPAAATPGAGSQQQLPAQPRRIYLVGGGSLNPAIARVVGDVLGGADGVYKLDVGGNACALGGAYKAVWALEREQRGDGDYESFDELIGRRWKEEGAIEKADQGYRPGVFERYGGGVLAAFEEMEKRILEVAHN